MLTRSRPWGVDFRFCVEGVWHLDPSCLPADQSDVMS